MAGAPRLGGATLDLLPPDVRRPGWLRSVPRVRTVHIGVGAFHRCHQAEVMEDLLEAGHDAALVAINLRPPRLGALLAPQDGFYTRTLREGDDAETRLVGAIRGVVDAEENPGGALDWLSTPEVTTVTMTVTEKGYCHVPATGALDLAHPDVRADLDGDLAAPRSLPGFLLAALRARRAEGAGPLNLVSCDNVAGNGRVLGAVVRGMAEAAAPDLLPWIEDHVAFPTTVVDRIVPATSPDDLRWLEERTGLRDEAAVFGEPFRQWVVEDDLRAPRPPWEEAGVEIVRDAEPYIAIKMRVLNGAQTMLSLMGALAGHEFSWQAATDPRLRDFVRRTLAEETLPHLPPVPGLDGPAYLDTSLRRIANPAIRHRCQQIATDSSQKIVPRLLAPLRACRAAGRPAPGLEAGVAAWLAYVAAEGPAFGGRWTVDDPVMARLRPLAGDIDGLATRLLGQEDVFGADLARDGALRARVSSVARRLIEGDMARALAGD